ncbi:MAG: lipid-A-disaccharide synthase, partial [Calditrichaceae bacterium]
CAILIDYPGFNLKIAKSLKKLGIPVIYYISPQLWAWGKGRIDKIRKYVDRMVVLFPFEQKFYEQYKIDAEYVGHPLVDKHSAYIPDEAKKISPDNIVFGLLPGSRRQEVASLLPKMIETARILFKNKQIKTAEIVKVKHLPNEMYSDHLKETDTFIKIIEEPIEKCLQRYDAVIVASGTATLETAYYGVPMLIVYHVNPLTYWLGRMLVKIEYIGLANIVAESPVAVELIQNDFTPEKAAEHAAQMLKQDQNSQIREKLKVIREKLGEPGASKRAAAAVVHFLDNNYPK